MDTKHFNTILKNPLQLKLSDLPLLNDIIKEYPYFQAPRAIRLKSLKEQKSHSYNIELKQTAAYTIDRGVLFNFITSKIKTEKELNNDQLTTVDNSEDIFIEATDNNTSVETLKITDAEASQIIDPFLFEEKTEENSPVPEIDIDAPLDFNKDEKHSFSEWLKLASLKPIVRKEEQETANAEPINTEIETEVKNEETTTQSINEIVEPIVEIEKPIIKKSNIESSLIDNFLKTNPKISPVKKDTPTINLANQNIISTEDLMTETLAKVYIAQKNYKKAIQAYKILSLKNPEKSGLFADQIRAIKKLQNNK